ncbi:MULTISPECIES: DUF3224 domain-containing protein [unclassified Comamonas]|uniref:DUF3224 domain-containing protein n=1 Tax=Comamonas squillarum TaxID=2977320 RepID=A0ABY6A100_9BURK|nr:MULTISPECIES: DUF3224 domain-containing protein [unclassified Comamonas]PWB14591.1 DUF3224 domain-containing protein [Comamonas sp. JNW]UXC17956.1 DUF3224 domain-containing protein [Comamonas sp. PR12]
MDHIATGRFDIKLQPEGLSSVAEATGLGRLSLDKQFSGDLQATSQGEMLSFRSTTAGSAGYVAMEHVQGSLHGRSGSFVLQHSASMAQGESTQSISVVPDSATDALQGLRGSMQITIDNGQHSYRFVYQLPEA